MDPLGSSPTLRLQQTLPGYLRRGYICVESSNLCLAYRACQMNRFFIYKEYAAKYDTMTADVGSAPSIIPNWELYQKGLEVLGSTIASARNRTDTLRKSLAVSDLIMMVCLEPHSLLLAWTDSASRFNVFASTHCCCRIC